MEELAECKKDQNSSQKIVTHLLDYLIYSLNCYISVGRYKNNKKWWDLKIQLETTGINRQQQKWQKTENTRKKRKSIKGNRKKENP